MIFYTKDVFLANIIINLTSKKSINKLDLYNISSAFLKKLGSNAGIVVTISTLISMGFGAGYWLNSNSLNRDLIELQSELSINKIQYESKISDLKHIIRVQQDSILLIKNRINGKKEKK